jgi:SAM-dependent methyltransferase
MINIDLIDNKPIPKDLTNKTVLDIGCWEGRMCIEAIKRNAKFVVGIDIGSSNELWKNIETYKFKFIQCDVFSEKFIELGQFDIVLCYGVLYHVENIISFLYRLRNATTQSLYLETVINNINIEHNVAIFHPNNTLKNNYSNWWTLNKECLFNLLTLTNFKDIKIHHISQPKNYNIKNMQFNRISLSANTDKLFNIEKINPRRTDRMKGSR